MTLQYSWAELRVALEKAAPRTAASLRPPEGAAAVREAELATGVAWPLELVALYSLCDGQDDVDPTTGLHPGEVVPRQLLFPLSTVLREHKLMVEIFRDIVDSDFEYYQRSYEELVDANQTRDGSSSSFLPYYVPFSGSDGYFYYCDCRRGSGYGTVSHFDKYDADRSDAIAGSLEQFIAGIAEAVRTMSAFDGWVPTVDDGAIHWTAL